MAMTRTEWRRCAGVNKRTGRVKSGYRVKKGKCPTAVAKKTKARRKSGKKKASAGYTRKRKPQISYYTGSDYGRGYERAQMAEKYDHPESMAEYYLHKIRPDLAGSKKSKTKAKKGKRKRGFFSRLFRGC